MKNRVLSLLAAISMVVTALWADAPLRITRTEVDLNAGTLLINGLSFGSMPPEVTLGQDALVILEYVPEDEILAELPAGLSAGTYLLTVTSFDLSESDTFNVTLGDARGVGPQITSTEVDDSTGELLILGYNFGDSAIGDPIPEVTLGDLLIPLTVLSFEDTAITALLPGMPPPGTYSLSVRVGQADSDTFDMSIGGDITEIVPGDGLAGGGAEGSVLLMADFAGSGSATSVARSDHSHDGSAIVSGTVPEPYVDAAIARDAEVAGLVAASAWSRFGNAGTVGGLHFLGTTDSQPLELRTNNQTALRLEPNATSPRLILGYSGNNASPGVAGATIAGGGRAGVENTVLGFMGAVGGGAGNSAGYSAFVGGGENNFARGMYNTVAGGLNNTTSGHPFSTVGGGNNNSALDYAATVGGGENNSAPLIGGTVAGGVGNTAGYWGSVPGGRDNHTSTYGFAAGRRAKAQVGSFVWSDSNDFDTNSFANNTFTARATGGVRFISAIDPSTGVATAGVQLASGGGAWSTLSDIRYKENFATPDPVEVLSKLLRMPIRSWNYKSQADTVRHIGPSAQDFYSAFGLGERATVISTIDADGVALSAIQGLQILLAERDAELEQLRSRLASLELRVESLLQSK